MSARILRTVSKVTAVFPADQQRNLALFIGDRAAEFGQRFDFAQIGVEQLERGGLMWRAQRGSWQRGERALVIESVHGREVELGVGVEGDTADAEELLREVWAVLGSMSGEAEVALDSAFPAREHQTVTVLQAEQPYWEHLERIGRTEALLRERLEGFLGESPHHLRIELPVHLRVGGLLLTRNLRIETRFTSDDGQHYIVASPLPSPDHRALLERFFGEVTDR